MEEMDDFGDLYADLEDHVNAGIDAIPGLHSSNMGGGNKCESKLDEADSGREECGSYPCGGINGKLTVSGGEGMPVLEAVDMNGTVEISCSSDSDDDDDLHIVLNEGDGPKFQSPQGVTLGVGGMVAGGSDDEDEGDDLVIVTGIDSQHRDLKRADKLPPLADGFVEGSAERHMESPLAKYPASTRTSMSRRGDWDQLNVPFYGGSASCNFGISAAAQNGVGFSLPRNRTIFDINIEAFEQKPWRRHGVDMTDYFNFGLDEESWKSYCNRLEHIRQQATASLRSKFYESPSNQGDRNSSVLQNMEKGGRGFDMPKGRAIQVEGGLGERLPSSDIRRPRHQDSDVVIQITMEGSMDEASSSWKKNLEHVEQGEIDDSLLNSANKLNESDDRRCGVRDNSVYHEEDHLRADGCMLEAGSASGDHVPCSSDSADLESHSETSKDAFSLEKVYRPLQKTPLISKSRLQAPVESGCNLSSDCRNDATESEQEAKKANKNKHVSRKKLRHTAELSASKDEECVSGLAYKRHQSRVDSWEASCKTRKRKSKYGTDVGGQLSSYRETEIVLSYKSKTHAVEHGNEQSYTKNSVKKCDQDTHSRRNCVERDSLKQRGCYLKDKFDDMQRITAYSRKDSDDSSSEHNSFVRKESCLLLANEKDDKSQVRMETEYVGNIRDYRYRVECEQKTHRRLMPYSDEEEIFDQKLVRHVSPTIKELGSPERRNTHDRTSYSDLNRSGRCTDDNAKGWRHPDYGLLSRTYREPYTTVERGWHDGCSPRSHLLVSWRSSESFDERRSPDTREFLFKNKKHRIASRSNSHNHSSVADDQDFGIHEHISESRDVYLGNIASSSKARRHDWLTTSRLNIHNGVSFRHREKNGLSSPERPSVFKRSSRHDKSHVNQHSVRGRIFSGDCQLNNIKQKIIVEGSSVTDYREHVSLVTDILNTGRHELADIGCRKAVNIHLNGWKGKLPRRTNGVRGESHRHRAKCCKIDEDPKGSRHIRNIDKYSEVRLHSVKGDGSSNHPTSLEVGRGQDSMSAHLDDHNKSSHGKYPITQQHQDEEIEEGQLIEEPDEQPVVSITKDQDCGKRVEKNLVVKDSLCNDRIVGRYDNSHIRETLAKMEKRKERFKEPIVSKQGPEKSGNLLLEAPVVDEVKQQRPARKRRWGSS